MPTDLTLVPTPEILAELSRRHMHVVVARNVTDEIMQIVCFAFGVEHNRLLSGRRFRQLSMCRAAGAHLLRDIIGLDSTQIARAIGVRDWSSVRAAYNRMAKCLLEERVEDRWAIHNYTDALREITDKGLLKWGRK